MTALDVDEARSHVGGPGSRAWPAWQVPKGALAPWLLLQARIDELRDQGRGPVCLNAWELWASSRAEDQAEALEACGWCPLLEACREYAVAAREPEGVWGGLTVGDRAALRAKAAA